MEKGTPISCRCPKCGSRDVNLYELFIVRDLYEVRNGVLDDRVSDALPDATGEVDGLCAKPDCRHRWRLRGNPIQAASEIVE